LSSVQFVNLGSLQHVATLNSTQLIGICAALPAAPVGPIIRFSTSGAPTSAAPFGSANGPYGPWHFHFNPDKEVPDAIATLFVTLEHYMVPQGERRERHVMFIDPAAAQDRLGNVSNLTRPAILVWATQRLAAQLHGKLPMPAAEYQTGKIVFRLKAAAQQRFEQQQAQQLAVRQEQRRQQTIASGPPLEAYIAQHNIPLAPMWVNSRKKAANGDPQKLVASLGITLEQAQDILKLPDL
jgi:hypothetical protein